MTAQAVIFGTNGLVLTDWERGFFREFNPVGFILFARNVQNPDQLKKLVDDMKSISGRDDTPILIDQEGGRVARLRPPHWPTYPAMKIFGDVYAQNPSKAAEMSKLNAYLLGLDLNEMGITVDCAPVVDLPAPGAHDVIGDRAFSSDAKITTELGQAFCDGLLEAGVCPVIKHIPGHGRATVDSHFDLPVIDTDLETLLQTDLLPFKNIESPWAMTAHVVLTSLDNQRPATISPIVVQDLIRQKLGFNGVLLTDSISMKALKGNLGDITRATLAAGNDLVLHCDGDQAGIEEVAKASQPLSTQSQARLDKAEALRRAKSKSAKATSSDTETLRTRLKEFLTHINADSLTSIDMEHDPTMKMDFNKKAI